VRALVIKDGALSIEDRPLPTPVADQVLVRVHGAGLNRADLLQRRGLYPPPPGSPPDIPGLEFSGVVEAAGEGVVHLRTGDRVLGLLGGGGQAEYVLTVESHCIRVPERLDLVEAGGVPEAFVTAHDAMLTQAGLHPGERVLIHAVASGVGTAALQLAACMGATVVGTSRNKEKLARAMELGLHHAVLAGPDLDSAALAQAVVDAAGPVQVVIDLVGGSYLEVDVAAIGPHGRIMIVGVIAGPRATLDMLTLMNKRAWVRGTVLRSRPGHEKAAAMHAFAGQVVPLLAAGSVRPVVEEVVPLAEAERAYDLLADDTTFGKVILDLR
jgi:putative PIG3 family NAD(P)H quinone oxidoreductase